MNRKHRRIVELIFSRPTSANVQGRDVASLFVELGAEIQEWVGSRVSVYLFGEVRVFHRLHASPNADKGAVATTTQRLNLTLTLTCFGEKFLA